MAIPHSFCPFLTEDFYLGLLFSCDMYPHITVKLVSPNILVPKHKHLDLLLFIEIKTELENNPHP